MSHVPVSKKPPAWRFFVTDDVGVAQINYPIWGIKAEQLGYDLTNIVDNIKMAKYIFDKQGIKAWACYRKLPVGT